jgi:PAS domain S-box-containing protein
MKDKNKKDNEVNILKARIKELEKSEVLRKQTEEKIEHLNLVLRAIRNVNQLIIKEKNMDVLIQKICEILIEDRGYSNAWIVLLGKQKEYINSAESGLSKSFIPMRKMLEEETLTNCGNSALKKKDLVIIKDPKKECIDCPLSANYSGQSSYSICIRHNNNIYGLLSVSVSRHYVDDKEEQDLFKEVAADIAFALYSIEVEKERKKAVEKLRIKDFAFQSSLSADSIGNNEGFITHANPSFARIWGYVNVGEVVGKAILDFLADKDKALEIIESINNTGNWEGEYTALRKDGTTFIAWSSANAVYDEEGNQTALYSSVVDITERKKTEEELANHKDHLEKLVKERTAELEEKNKELMRYNKLFIGREFRIKELKDKVKELEKELGIKK